MLRRSMVNVHCAMLALSGLKVWNLSVVFPDPGIGGHGHGPWSQSSAGRTIAVIWAAGDLGVDRPPT